MKSIALCIVSCITALSVFAQSTVTIEVNGSRNKVVLVDGQSYTVSNYYSTSAKNKSLITIPDLPAGQHTLQLKRTKGSSSQTVTDTRQFHVRTGFDLLITVNGNGALTLKETKRRTTGVNRTPMTDAGFNELYRSIQDEWRSSARMTLLRNEFNNTSNYFTTSQASKLILLTTSESNRLMLAKLAVHRITDVNNITQLYDVLKSQNSRNELAAYVKANNITSSATVRAPMSSLDFEELLEDVKDEWNTNAKVALLTTEFQDVNNFFNAAQVRLLLFQIPDESNRLTLAKLASHQLTDIKTINQIYDVFNSQHSRNELAAYVRTNVGTTTNTGAIVRTPITNADFNELYSDVQNEYSTSAKVTLLNTAFGHPSAFFTSSQAKQLILLIPDESNRLHLAKTVYRGITDPANFNIMYDVFNSQATRNELGAYLNTNYGVVYNNNMGSDGYKTPMSDNEYNSLYREVQNTWGLSAKMTTLSSIFANTSYYFTTAQAKELVKLVSSESNRFELAKAAYDNITDAGNFANMYDVLESQSSRDQLAAWVNSYTYNNTSAGTNYSYRAPMSDSEYNTLYRSVQNTWGLGAKMSSLTNIFANNSYFFTTAQAKELVKLVSAESNRLQLAKSSYDNITDPNNFKNMYDVLASQSSRDDLAAFVNSNSQNRQ